MTLWLRKVRKSKWYRNVEVPWLEEGELQADAFSDLSTRSNKLSWWLIEDDRSNLERVVAALASKCDDLSIVDCVILDDESVARLNLAIAEAPGDTPDGQANEKWHRDFLCLTTEKLQQLAEEICLPDRILRFNSKKVKAFIEKSVVAGQIDLSQVKETIRQKVISME